MKASLPPLILGTAQLGMAYGIANRSGRPDMGRALEIIKAALERGISAFDTAQSYGESEQVLGQCFSELGVRAKVDVITKINADRIGDSSVELAQRIETSRRTLGMDRIFAVLAHSGEWLNAWGPLGEALARARDKGFVLHGGASVYTADEMRLALENPDVEIIQVPGNVFDQRLLSLGWLKEAQERGKSIMVRSLYLQGLLLMDVHRVPAALSFAVPRLELFRKACEAHALSAPELALGFCIQAFKGCSLVVGAELPEQIAETSALWKTAAQRRLDMAMISGLAKGVEDRLILPFMWGNS